MRFKDFVLAKLKGQMVRTLQVMKLRVRPMCSLFGERRIKKTPQGFGDGVDDFAREGLPFINLATAYYFFE